MVTNDCPKPPATESAASDHGPAQDASKSGETDEFEQSSAATSDALKLLRQQLRELKEYFSYYVSAKTDSAKLRLRSTVFWIVLAAVGFITFCGVLITAGWFLLGGIAGGLGVLFGNRLWIGNLATGVLVFAGLGLGAYFAMARRMNVSRKRTVQKYEERQKRQQSEFGHDVRGQTDDDAATNQ